MLTRRLPAGRASVAEMRFSDRSCGDFRVDGDPDEIASRRQQFMSGDWTWLRQVHGSRVVDVSVAGEHAGTEADAAVTALPGAVLAVQTADCVPVVFVASGAVGVAHAGWRGLVGGVLQATVTALGRVAEGPIEAIIGPCIGPTNYEFGEAELALVEGVAGPTVRATTARGTPALDLTAAVASILAGAGVDRVSDVHIDTAGDAWYSHRVRGDVGRQATVVRLVQQ